MFAASTQALQGSSLVLGCFQEASIRKHSFQGDTAVLHRATAGDYRTKTPPRCIPVRSCAFEATLTSGLHLGQTNQLEERVLGGARHIRKATRLQAALSEGAGIDLGSIDGQQSTFARFSAVLTTAFPLWVALSCGLALYRPSSFSWIQGQLTIWALGLTMLGMGTTLSLSDFQLALRIPKKFLAGVALQYTVMPSLGYLIAHSLGLPHHYAVGIILVACCPGGTASNIVTFLAKGDVALSVLMTAASTFLAVLMTPLLTAWLAGTLVAVDAWGLFSSTLQVVLLPVLLGSALNHFFPRATAAIGAIAPLFAVFTVAAVCGSAIGANASAIWASGASLALAVLLLHGGGFFCGYSLAKVLGLDESSARTISIEVGMQNSVLGVVLATQNFPNPLTAAPCAVSSVCHSIIASVLAGLWRASDRRKDRGPAAAAVT